MTVQTKYTALAGGTDLMSPYLQVGAGRAIESLNYEALPKGGCRKVKGYKLYDGNTTTQAAIPGSGDVRGVHVYNGVLYGFRDQTGPVGGMFKETSLGWTAVSMPSVLYFDGGLVEFLDGQAVNGQTSGATATITRAVLGRGTLASNTGEGVLVLSGITGTFQNNENLRIGATVYAVANGVVSTYVLPAGGFYRFINHNFYGQAATKRMYAANGVGDAFEYNGTTLVPIPQGPTGYCPSHIAAFQEHLVLGYSGGSVVGSATGVPTDFTALNGAYEVTTGDNLTDIKVVKGNVLMLGCEESIQALYGVDAGTFTKKTIRDKGGIRPNSLNVVGDNIIALDALGVQNIQTVNAYGDYSLTPISYDVEVALKGALNTNPTVISQFSQVKSQYRLFFGANAFFFTFNSIDLAGAMLIGFEDVVRCACTGQDSNGLEIMFFGSENGKVFKMETTNFFNGEPIATLLRLPFGFEKSPTQRKRYHKMVVDMKVEGAATLISGYADYNFGQGVATRFMDVSIIGTGNAKWNQVLWNQFKWAAPSYAAPNLPIRGLGYNMGLVLAGRGIEDSVVSMYGLVTHYSMRKLLRANV